MPTSAYSAYGTEMRLSDGVAIGVPITAATWTTPIVITTLTQHLIADVGYGTVVGVLGNPAANGAWILEAVTPFTLRLRGSVGNGVYTSGGNLVLAGTFAPIAELRDVQDAGSRTDLIDVSSHDGDQYSSEIPTLKRTNTIRLDINYVVDHPTHNETTGLMALYETGERRDWLLVLPPYPGTGVKAAGHLYGAVTYYTMPLPVNGAVQQQVELAFDGALTWRG
jgi:hypothetical protein